MKVSGKKREKKHDCVWFIRSGASMRTNDTEWEKGYYAFAFLWGAVNETVVEKERCTFDRNGKSIEIDGRVEKIRAIAIPERATLSVVNRRGYMNTDRDKTIDHIEGLGAWRGGDHANRERIDWCRVLQIALLHRERLMLRDIPFPIQQLQLLQPSADSSKRSVVLQDNDMLHRKRLSANTQEKKLRESWSEYSIGLPGRTIR